MILVKHNTMCTMTIRAVACFAITESVSYNKKYELPSKWYCTAMTASQN